MPPRSYIASAVRFNVAINSGWNGQKNRRGYVQRLHIGCRWISCENGQNLREAIAESTSSIHMSAFYWSKYDFTIEYNRFSYSDCGWRRSDALACQWKYYLGKCQLTNCPLAARDSRERVSQFLPANHCCSFAWITYIFVWWCRNQNLKLVQFEFGYVRIHEGEMYTAAPCHFDGFIRWRVCLSFSKNILMHYVLWTHIIRADYLLRRDSRKVSA